MNVGLAEVLEDDVVVTIQEEDAELVEGEGDLVEGPGDPGDPWEGTGGPLIVGTPGLNPVLRPRRPAEMPAPIAPLPRRRKATELELWDRWQALVREWRCLESWAGGLDKLTPALGGVMPFFTSPGKLPLTAIGWWSQMALDGGYDKATSVSDLARGNRAYPLTAVGIGQAEIEFLIPQLNDTVNRARARGYQGCPSQASAPPSAPPGETAPPKSTEAAESDAKPPAQPRMDDRTKKVLFTLGAAAFVAVGGALVYRYHQRSKLAMAREIRSELADEQARRAALEWAKTQEATAP